MTMKMICLTNKCTDYLSPKMRCRPLRKSGPHFTNTLHHPHHKAKWKLCFSPGFVAKWRTWRNVGDDDSVDKERSGEEKGISSDSFHSFESIWICKHSFSFSQLPTCVCQFHPLDVRAAVNFERVFKFCLLHIVMLLSGHGAVLSSALHYFRRDRRFRFTSSQRNP